MLKISICLIAALTWASPAMAACPARVIRSPTEVVLSDSDCAIGFDRPSPTRVMLPPHPHNGKIIRIYDLGSNFVLAPVFVAPNVGQKIARLPGNTELNIDGASWTFRFFATGSATGIWGFNKQ